MNDTVLLMEEAWRESLAAVEPRRVMAELSLAPSSGRTVVVGAGKAAAGMAAALETQLAGAWSGLVIVPYGAPGAPLARIERREAAHPDPDEAGAAATREIVARVAGLAASDRVIVLLSGGASALLTAPRGLSLAEKAAAARALMAAGADIRELNTVRKHLSRVKGGRLALLAHPAEVVTLIMSDVMGDDPAVVGSGPTVADATTAREALATLDRHRVTAPAMRAAIVAEAGSEAPARPGDPRLARVTLRCVADNRLARAAAVRRLERAGYRVTDLGEAGGEARELAQKHAAAARRLAPGEALVSGGECTVTVRGTGRGGRNQEYLLALALELAGENGLYAGAAGTDGVDGSSDAAGAWLAPATLAHAAKAALFPAPLLAANDSHAFFAALGAQWISGPTGVNVNDVRIILRKTKRWMRKA